MSTRKRTNNINGSSQPNNLVDPTPHASENLPSTRKGKAVKRTSAPLSKASFSNVIYGLALVAACMVAFYTWRLTIWKSQAGGWFNLVMGKHPSTFTSSGSAGTTQQQSSAGGLVESRISELAGALGIPAATLATAIASAIRDHVPPATLSSISANEAPTASVVKLLVQDQADLAKESAESLTNKLSGVVGMDDPTGFD